MPSGFVLTPIWATALFAPLMLISVRFANTVAGGFEVLSPSGATIVAEMLILDPGATGFGMADAVLK